jgi:Domain of unknown function (DUF4124)
MNDEIRKYYEVLGIDADIFIRKPYVKGNRNMKNLKPIIMTNMYRTSRTPVFIITIFLMAFSLICPRGTQGGEIYTYTDKDGVTVISNTPIPEKYHRKAQKIDSYKDLTPTERSELEREAANQLIDKQLRADSKRQQRDIGAKTKKVKAQMSQQHMNSYTAKDAFGTPVNSDNFHLTRDAFGNIVGSDNTHLTRDAFGTIVNSDTPHLTKDAFGTIIMSK